MEKKISIAPDEEKPNSSIECDFEWDQYDISINGENNRPLVSCLKPKDKSVNIVLTLSYKSIFK